MKYSYDVIKKFTDRWYSNIITINDIPDTKKSVKFKSDKEEAQIHGWVINVSGYKCQIFVPETLFVDGVETNTLDLLPIKISNTEEFTFENNRYARVNSIKTFRIKPELIIQPEDIFQDFCDINHSSPDEYKTLVAIALGSLVYRINWRISSCAGFGKDGIFESLQSLMQNYSFYSPESTSKLLKGMHESNCCIINEFMDLKKSTKEEFARTLKVIGDRSITVKNPSHATKAFGTLDSYDISKCSFGVVYNELSYYMDSGRDYRQFFDFIYDHAIKTRYFPLLLNQGQIDTMQFSLSESKVQELFESNEKHFINIVKSLKWLIENPDECLKGKLNWLWYKDKLSTIKDQRVKINMINILKSCKLFAKTEQEYNNLADGVWSSYIRYIKALEISGE